MTISMYSSGKGSACVNLKFFGTRSSLTRTCSRRQSTSPVTNSGNGKSKVNNASVSRQLFMDVLEANATRRDAKQYLARFKPSASTLTSSSDLIQQQQQRNERSRRDQDRLDCIGVNLGGLYAPARAIAESPKFTRQEVEENAVATDRHETHVALVLFREPQSCDDSILDGVALTLSQLVKLDMAIAIVLDLGMNETNIRLLRADTALQADRVRDALERHSVDGARLVTGALEIPDHGDFRSSDLDSVEITIPGLVREPLQRGVVPILPAIAHGPTGRSIQVAPESVMLALTREFCVQSRKSYDNHKVGGTSNTTSIDRVIILDPSGGIPSRDRNEGSHVFINLKQEYLEIYEQLTATVRYKERSSSQESQVYQKHARNLQVTQECLSMLPSSSSAVIITPEEAASSSLSRARDDSDVVGAGTRKQKNTLIHNLLTNKPMVSSSLPAARMSSASASDFSQPHIRQPSATLVKLGMPLAVLPTASRTEGWLAPSTGSTTLDLMHDNQVDFPLLLHLIENSFRRKLDVQHYFNRIKGSTAGLIVAGKYEGGAILTWETPASLKQLPPEHPDRIKRLVPYLDKFAVLQSSQGSAGVADIVFQAMVRTCFPHGVCWRSRKDNPVNKWYFERSTGSWQIPGTNWTMFWTGDGVVDDAVKFADYVEVCRDVMPSWADGKKAD